LQVSIVVFRALSKKISGKDGSAPLEKIGPYAYGYCEVNTALNKKVFQRQLRSVEPTMKNAAKGWICMQID